MTPRTCPILVCLLLTPAMTAQQHGRAPLPVTQLAAGTEVPGLDQLPEALLPLWALPTPLGIGLSDGLLVTAVFLVLDLACVRLRHR